MTPSEQQKLWNETKQAFRNANNFIQNFRIVGSGVSGNIRTGFSCRTPPCEEPAAAGSSGAPSPPPPTGACCAEDGSCTITTEAECTGIYQGDDTICDPNPCPQPAGACCVDTDCSITTEEECAGIYQGDDTVCDPNPCDTPCCDGCGYVNPDDGLHYLSKIITNTPEDDCPPEGGCCCIFETGESSCAPWTCNRWRFFGSCPQEFVSRLDCYTDEFGCHCPSDFLPDCSDPGVSCESITITKYCESTCALNNGTCPICDEPECSVSFCCPPSCEPGSTSCTSVTQDISYENPCNNEC